MIFAQEVMTTDFPALSAETPVAEVLQWFEKTGLPGLPIVDAKRKLLGVVLKELSLNKTPGDTPVGK